MDIWNLIAERKIQEAMEEGAFDHLDGAGKPLPLDENPYEDAAQRMAHRILRNNGFAPTWIEEAREIDADLRRLESDRARCSDAEYRRRIAELNRRIEAYNLKTPVALTQRQTIRL
jgi:hypothetical protein